MNYTINLPSKSHSYLSKWIRKGHNYCKEKEHNMEKLFFLPNFFHETNHLLIEDSNLHSEVGTRKRTKKKKKIIKAVKSTNKNSYVKTIFNMIFIFL